jgi:hypothetical protein
MWKIDRSITLDFFELIELNAEDTDNDRYNACAGLLVVARCWHTLFLFF